MLINAKTKFNYNVYRACRDTWNGGDGYTVIFSLLVCSTSGEVGIPTSLYFGWWNEQDEAYRFTNCTIPSNMSVPLPEASDYTTDGTGLDYFTFLNIMFPFTAF